MLPHDVIRHNSEYVRGEIHTQGIEGFWAVLKRGLIGTYHHVDAGYLTSTCRSTSSGTTPGT